jgi:hypothetical protein
MFSNRENKIGAVCLRQVCSARVPGGEIFNGFRERVFRESASFMFETWSDWWAGEEFQRQSTGNQRQNTKRDVSHGVCKSMHGAKGFYGQNQPDERSLRPGFIAFRTRTAWRPGRTSALVLPRNESVSTAARSIL